MTLDRIERRMGAGLDLVGVAITAAALGVGAHLAQAGAIDPAQAAVGVFAALALAEAVAPVRRALSEIGRMVQAARRVLPNVAPVEAAQPMGAAPEKAALSVTGLTHRHADGGPALFAPVSLALEPGETVALTGPSGSGKSTVLLLVAGAISPSEGQIRLGGRPLHDWSPEALKRAIAMVPQRHALIAGTLAENLRLAAPGADEAALWRALEAVSLDDTVRAKGGLDATLGFRGAGLSGGEARRLVLARAILRDPALLLLDEPTEGLDTDTAARVMAGIRAALPRAAILLAAHRPGEIAFADRIMRVERAQDKTSQ
jgi:ATP-binding cassette subfamily C protein CydC